LSLRIHADRSIVPPGGAHVVMLHPFWGTNAENPDDPTSGRFDRYAEVGGTFLELTSPEIADLIVFPCEWSTAFASHLSRVEAAAVELGKPVAVFSASDDHEGISDTALVLQTSLYRSRRRPNDFAQPAWSEDFVNAHLGGELPLRPKRSRPVVSFCGLTSSSGLLRRLRAHPAHTSIRARALRLLREHAGVGTNFVERSHFLGGALGRSGLDVAAMQRVRAEYVENMIGGDYVLCARGAGNFSYRLYETLSCGRIPVFVDTDSVLPVDFSADWRGHCVWIDESELESIGDRVVAFHEGLSEHEFVGLQRACRRFWETYVSPEGFFAHFHEHLERV